MSIKMAKLKNYIKETYEKLGNIPYADYWNLGYIDALMIYKIIDEDEGMELGNYSDRVAFIEKQKIIDRKKDIEEEEEKGIILKRIKRR